MKYYLCQIIQGGWCWGTGVGINDEARPVEAGEEVTFARDVGARDDVVVPLHDAVPRQRQGDHHKDGRQYRQRETPTLSCAPVGHLRPLPRLIVFQSLLEGMRILPRRVFTHADKMALFRMCENLDEIETCLGSHLD